MPCQWNKDYIKKKDGFHRPFNANQLKSESVELLSCYLDELLALLGVAAEYLADACPALCKAVESSVGHHVAHACLLLLLNLELV